jgi:hypothetical protein
MTNIGNGYLEFRNENPYPIKIRPVIVKATGNIFIYIGEMGEPDPKYISVPSNYFEVIKLEEVEF